VLLDVELIRARRNELGLSHRAVARRLGVSSLLVGRLEDGTNHEEITLRLLSRLADLLAIDLADLLTTSRRASDNAADVGDVSHVGALLVSVDEPVAPATLAETLDTTHAETADLLTELDQALQAAGLRLQVGPDGARIVGDVSRRDSDRLRRLLRGQHARHGLNGLDALLLARAAAGTLDTQRAGNAEQVALARMRNAGMLDDNHELSDDVRYSLGLDPTT
jgi:transcriptional regulator with XRE-family HTH domain